MKMVHTYLGFKGKKLITIILSLRDDEQTAIDCDHYVKVEDPVHAKTNLKTWLKEHGCET